tara:strand:+ start:414 stop:605 length:192 start_codon:yes stop_codon:yes gene_type:complete
MFLIGIVVFTFYITGFIWEMRIQNKEENIDYKNYYERHSITRVKQPKRKKGSQSRLKNYNWKK